MGIGRWIEAALVAWLFWELIDVRRQARELYRWKNLHNTELEQIKNQLSAIRIKLIELREAQPGS